MIKIKSTKYMREYGMTLKEMVEKYGGAVGTYQQLHNKGKLHQELDKLKSREIKEK